MKPGDPINGKHQAVGQIQAPDLIQRERRDQQKNKNANNNDKNYVKKSRY